MVEAQLGFNPRLKTIFPQTYRADLLPEGSDVAYGVHFVSGPPEIKPGDQHLVGLLLRAFPEDQCMVFQPGQKVFLKEGPNLVRAEGTITRRWEHESPSRTVIELLSEFAKAKHNPQ